MFTFFLEPPQSRIPRLPIFKKPNPVLLTDDEDSSDDDKVAPSANLKNPIFNSSNDVDKTFCSEIEKKNSQQVSKQISKPLFGTDELEEDAHTQKSAATQAETVVGSFSSDEDQLSQQLSGLKIKSAKKKSMSSRMSDLKDTVYDPFDSDESLDGSSKTQKKFNKTLNQSKKSAVMRETIVGDFDSDEDNEEIENFAKPSNLPPKSLSAHHHSRDLRETIDNPFNYTESEIDVTKKSLKKVELEKDIHTTTDKFSEIELNDSEDDESEGSDLECITVLDSDEEIIVNSQLNSADGPPKINPQDSYENCSSIAPSEQKNSRDTDNTLNRFFNNPPSLESNKVVTHSIIHKQFKQPTIPEEKPTTTGPDTTENPFDHVIDDSFELEATIRSDDEIVDATIMTDENDGQEVSLSEESFKSTSTDHAEAEKSSHETQLTLPPSTAVDTQDTEKGEMNFDVGGMRLRINMNIEIAVETESESENSSSSEEESQKAPEKKPETPKVNVKINSAKNTPRTPANTSKQTARSSNQKSSASKLVLPQLSVLRGESPMQSPLAQPKPSSKAVDFITPTRTNSERREPSVIDDDLQKILSDLYGESWKTPQLLKSCQRKKNVDNLRKSIAANNFESCEYFNLSNHLMCMKNEFLLLYLKS